MSMRRQLTGDGQGSFLSRCVQDDQGLCISTKDQHGKWQTWAHLHYPSGTHQLQAAASGGFKMIADKLELSFFLLCFHCCQCTTEQLRCVHRGLHQLAKQNKIIDGSGTAGPPQLQDIQVVLSASSPASLPAASTDPLSFGSFQLSSRHSSPSSPAHSPSTSSPQAPAHHWLWRRTASTTAAAAPSSPPTTSKPSGINPTIATKQGKSAKGSQDGLALTAESSPAAGQVGASLQSSSEAGASSSSAEGGLVDMACIAVRPVELVMHSQPSLAATNLYGEHTLTSGLAPRGGPPVLQVTCCVMLDAHVRAPGDPQEEVKVETAGLACLQILLAGRLQAKQLMFAPLQVARLVSLPNNLRALFFMPFSVILNRSVIYLGRRKTGFMLA